MIKGIVIALLVMSMNIGNVDMKEPVQQIVCSEEYVHTTTIYCNIPEKYLIAMELEK